MVRVVRFDSSKIHRVSVSSHFLWTRKTKTQLYVFNKKLRVLLRRLIIFFMKTVKKGRLQYKLRSEVSDSSMCLISLILFSLF